MKHAREVGIRLRGKRGTHRSVVLLVLVALLVQGPVVSSAAYRTGVHAGGSAEYVSVSQGLHRSAPKTSHPSSQKLWTFDYTTCATSNDVVRCWGSGLSPVFGLPALERKLIHSTPNVIGTTLPNLTDLSESHSYACGVSNGGVKCWGEVHEGVIGSPSGGFLRTPIEIAGLTSGVTSVVVSNLSACAVADSSLRCWGLHDPFNRYLVTRIPKVVAGLESGVEAIVGGSGNGNHQCVLIRGGVKCAGYNGNSELGDGGTRASYQNFVDVVGLPSGSGVTAIAIGSGATCAIVNGGVKCWGIGETGRLGNSNVTNSSTPVDVSGLGSGSGVTSISTSRGHTCAIVNSGVLCWGKNQYGQLGDGTTKSSTVPVQVLGIGPGSGATDVTVGNSHTCAIVRGDVFCWGSNGNGSLGDGSGKSSSTPIGVRGLSATTTPQTEPAGIRKCLKNELYLLGYSYRGFENSRQGTTINWTFRYRSEDDALGITKWEVIPLHPKTGKSKKEDLAFAFGNGCERLSNKEIALYKPSTVQTVPIERHPNGKVKQWSFTGSIPKARDEVDRVALVGFNARGERVAFHVRRVYSGPRQGGTIMGKIENLKCRVSVAGLPIAQATYVVTHKSIQALDMAGIPQAGKANLVLEGFAIYQGVDADGRVTAQVGFSFDGSEKDKEKLKQYAEMTLNAALDKYVSTPEVLGLKTALVVEDGKLKFGFEVAMYLEGWLEALDAIGETVRNSSSDICKFWS